MFICTTFLWSCSNDEDKVASEIFNVRLGISVVDGEGNDLLDPNNEHHISLDDIQITYYNHYGDENEIARMEFYESDDDDVNFLGKNVLMLTPYLPGGIPYYAESWHTGRYVIDWGNGYGKDNITYEAGSFGRMTVMTEIYVNGELSFKRKSGADSNYVVIKKQGE